MWLIMNAVLDPAILFMSETDWYDEIKQDDFLNHLLKNLEYIDEYSSAKIYWNDDFESSLWASPQQPPWRTKRDLNLQIVPILFKLFAKNKIEIQNPNNLHSCDVSPYMNKCHSDNLNDYFLKLMHKIIDIKEDVFLCLAIQNRLSDTNQYSFSCTCHSNTLVPDLINKPDDWLYHIDLENDYWPNSTKYIENFMKAIDIVKKRDFGDKPFLYNYKFSEGFIKDIIAIKKNKTNIIESIAKRLVLTTQEAGQDHSLQHEYLNHEKQYRFRVTLAYRIQYKFSNEKEIVFLNCGNHDYGLH